MRTTLHGLARLGLALLLSTAYLSAWAGSDAEPGQRRSAQEVYGQICAHCHETRIGPDLKGRALSPEVTRHFVRFGKRAMPAWRPTEVSDQELQRLVLWIQAAPARSGER